MNSCLAWLANLLLIVGAWQAGHKRRHAYANTFVGEILWLVVASRSTSGEAVPMAVLCLIFAMLAARNWWLWGNDGREEKYAQG